MHPRSNSAEAMSNHVAPFAAARRDQAMHALIGLFGRQIRYGTLRFELPDGGVETFRGEISPDFGADLRLVSYRALRRVLTGGDLGFAEAYMAGEIDTSNLTNLLIVGAENEAAWAEQLKGRFWYRTLTRLGHLLRPNSRRGARRNIEAHYDLGNDFYSQWLDPSMTYSSAVFDRAGQESDLEIAQRNKYRLIAEKAGLEANDRVLEIGCGWGGFAAYAAREIGCRVLGITISPSQYDYACWRLRRDGAEERARIELIDYRDVTDRFDKIVSIEMFEAVGDRYWPTFFDRLHDCLRPGGRAALQVITIADSMWDQYRRGTDFIQRYIFPGGMLPSPTVLRERVAGAGLEWLGSDGYGLDYARTLATWYQRFEGAWPSLKTLGFDEKFRRMWRYYFCYCEAGFQIGRVDVKQIALARS